MRLSRSGSDFSCTIPLISRHTVLLDWVEKEAVRMVFSERNGFTESPQLLPPGNPNVPEVNYFEFVDSEPRGRRIIRVDVIDVVNITKIHLEARRTESVLSV
jgi:hypothetical protein